MKSIKTFAIYLAQHYHASVNTQAIKFKVLKDD